MATRRHDRLSGSFTTVNNTEISALAFTPSASCAICVKVNIVARSQSSGDGACWEQSAMFTVDGGGTITRKFTPNDIVRQRDDATWTVDVDANVAGTAIETQLKGDATETVDWGVFCTIHENVP